MKFVREFMKITPTVLSLPPYLSTTWSNIASLRLQETLLVVTLYNGTEVEVPGLDQDHIDAIFEAHTRYGGVSDPKDSSILLSLEGGSNPLSSFTQHNPEQADLPPLSPELLQKLSEMAKTLGLENTEPLSQPEIGCNCLYCQVTRALVGGPLAEEEVVAEDDLHFRDWDIAQKGDKLYLITNPLDQNEHYNVFLGEPLGCTCGQKNCEHIRAVLNT
jgi:hypothetical protein